jgi:hypothetical protein
MFTNGASLRGAGQSSVAPRAHPPEDALKHDKPTKRVAMIADRESQGNQLLRLSINAAPAHVGPVDTITTFAAYLWFIPIAIALALDVSALP